MTSPTSANDAHDPDTYVIRPTLPPMGPESAVIPALVPPDAPRRRFARGRTFPRAITWFGLQSFWGHLWHMAASVIATEDIDSRDWMVADRRRDLNARIATRLGGAEAAGSLTEALGRDLWIDFIADTGDDSSVSESVARALFSTYELADPDHQGRTIELPRGDVLVFGGDTAYPVATDLEIHNRVVVPYNRVLREIDDGRPRVLLGIPGNHDWYAGLDGFGRMFRRRTGSLNRQKNATEVDRFGQVGHFVQWIEAFSVGQLVAKRSILPLLGYSPVQSASYWALRIAPKLDLWGVDRQLRTVDAQQRGYFSEERSDGVGVALVIPDPVFAYLEPNLPGVEILEALDLSIERDRLLVLVGDTHHYCRLECGGGTHVTAGGGGAFLHPARVNRRPHHPVPKAEFPGPRQSRALLMSVPWRMATGRSGLVVHIALALIYLPTYGVALAYGRSAALSGSIITAMLATIVGVLLGGWRKERPWRIALVSVITGSALGFAPFIIHFILRTLLGLAGLGLLIKYSLLIQYAAAVMSGAFTAGVYLMALALLGLDHNQAFGALAHPGFKHFVRLRVRKDGSRIDAWVLGKVDPVNKDEPVVLVDTFRWENPAKPSPPTHLR